MEGDQLRQLWDSLPKFTRSYLVSVFVTTLCISYIKYLPVFYWFYLDLDKVVSNVHLWRLITNFFIVGKFSFNFLFFMLMM